MQTKNIFYSNDPVWAHKKKLLVFITNHTCNKVWLKGNRDDSTDFSLNALWLQTKLVLFFMEKSTRK